MNIVFVQLWWCPTCEVVWAGRPADPPPLCRHFAIDGPPVEEMAPLPRWHPLADSLSPTNGAQ